RKLPVGRVQVRRRHLIRFGSMQFAFFLYVTRYALSARYRSRSKRATACRRSSEKSMGRSLSRARGPRKRLDEWVLCVDRNAVLTMATGVVISLPPKGKQRLESASVERPIMISKGAF